jgi:hypothetical protein
MEMLARIFIIWERLYIASTEPPKATNVAHPPPGIQYRTLASPYPLPP